MKRYYSHFLFIIPLFLLPGCFGESEEKLSKEQKKQYEQEARSLNIDFDAAMQADLPAHAAVRNQWQQWYDIFKNLYQRNNLARVPVSASPKIEKIIHHVWLGSKMPDCYENYYTSWLTHHPRWTTIFWTDNKANYHRGTVVVSTFKDLDAVLAAGKEKHIVVDVAGLQFDNKPYFNTAINYGEKSDILKWEIVYRCGGVYVDTDYECYRSMDLLHHMYDFYTGMQPLDTVMVQLGAGLFSAKKGHPILKQTVEGIKKNQHISQIIAKTGPVHFTRTFLQAYGTCKTTDIVLPASFLYPCGYEQRGTDNALWKKPESLAVHHWAGSWLKPEAFVKPTVVS